MSPVDLIDAICEFLTLTVKDLQLKTQSGDERPPQIVAGYLPPKNPKKPELQEDDFPFVIARLISLEDVSEKGGGTGRDYAQAVVRLVIGTYSHDAQDGWRDVANTATRIWIDLFKKRVIAKKYRIEYPCLFEMPEEQPYPQWIGEMTTRWVVPRPLEEIYDQEVILDGEFFK
jgi:hypothetical protein